MSELKAVRPPRFFRQLGLLKDPAVFFAGLIESQGDFVHYQGLLDFYLINDAVLVSHLFKQTHRQFNKETSVYRCFHRALGNSLIASEGENWKRRRKMMTPTFTPAAVNVFFELMREQAERTLTDWDGEMDFGPAMNRLAMEVSGKALFSRSFDARSEDIFDWIKTVNHYSARTPLPVVGAPWFPRPSTFRMKRTSKDYLSFIKELIAERREEGLENPEGSEGEDLFSILLNMRDEETGEGFSDEEIAEEMLGMIIGSHETTGATLTWFFFELGKNPGVHQSLVAEVDQVTKGQALQPETLSSLPLLKQTFYETMRLHPPFWFENRNATEEVTLGGERLPKGALVVFSRHALHRNEKYWPEPEEFRPSRFDESVVKVEELIRQGCYVPFGSGPRVCIGRHLAMAEMMMIAAGILQKFEVRVPGGQSEACSTKMTMELRDGLRVQLSTRA